MPADFGSLGTEGHIYISGQTLPSLIWTPPDELEALRFSTTAESQYPTHYTLRGKTSAGLSKIQVWMTPGSNLTLAIRNYVKRVPFPIDRPPAIAAGAGASGTNLNGSYRWRMTFVTASGETEGGTISDALSLQSDAATLTLPLSEATHLVTSRKVYRTAASGTSYLLAATVSDNTTTTLVDDLADGGLGDAAPAVTAAVTGTEEFPEDFHESVLVGGAIKALATMQGDMRDAGFSQKWKSDVRRLWAEQRQGQNTPEGFNPYGVGNRLVQGRRWRLLS